MKKILTLLALAAFAHAGAWAATYTYSSYPYDPASLHDHIGGCGEGLCGNFTAAMQQTVSFTTVGNLPSNANSLDIKGLITTFSFSDGLTTYASGDPQVEVLIATASTDAAGALTNLAIYAKRWQVPGPHVIADANTRIDMLNLGVVSYHNLTCTVIVPRPLPLGDGCTAQLPNGNSGWADVGLVPASVQSVPVDNPFALVLTVVGLLGLALRRRCNLRPKI